MFNICLALLGGFCLVAGILAIMTFANSGPRDHENGEL